MACENPLMIRNPRYKGMTARERRVYAWEHYKLTYLPDLYIEVPCGKCHSCFRRRMNDYRFRLLYEHNKYPNSIFLTLTFDEKNLKRFEKEPNKAVLLFLDRCRKRFGKSLRHWFCSEYGSLNGRIHYHGIVFNIPGFNPADFNSKTVSELWSYGYVYVGYCNPETMSYITKYVTKTASKGLNPPRIISSKGIGEGYLTPRNILYHNDGQGNYRPYVDYGSFRFPLPRYYYNKLFSESDKDAMIVDREMFGKGSYIWQGKEYCNKLDYLLARRATFVRNRALKLSFDRKQKIS